MNIVLITTCSNRKRKPIPDMLKARNLPIGNFNSVLREWANRLLFEHTRYPVDTLYCGRGFIEMERLSKRLKAPLYVISSGLGLLFSRDHIPSYNLTIKTGSSDSILNKVVGNQFDLGKWWTGINFRNKPNPVTNLIRSMKGKIVIFAISSTYWPLIENDLANLSKSELKNVRITGIPASCLPGPMKANVLPYDQRFDGPDSPIPGTKSDYAQRTCVHYLKFVLPNTSLANDRENVRRLMEKLKPRIIIRRQRRSDEQIITHLTKRMKCELSITSAQMLRYLRDDIEISCEQRRFSRLYKIARSRLNEGTENNQA
jgi:hypothetical protein